MTFIKTVKVYNIRSHEAYDVSFSPNVSIITGANGSGKTTLLEAVYISLQGSSFKGSDNDILRKDQPWWKIDLILDDDQRRVVTFDPKQPSRKKQFDIDGKKNARLITQYKHPVVLFEPEDLRLLNGSPARRRLFIDRFISQLNPKYITALRAYERALRQRNILLKQQYPQEDQLFVWNLTLAEHGSYIIEQRLVYIEKINSTLTNTYQHIAGTEDEVTAEYSHEYKGVIKQKLLQELHTSTTRDTYIGSTSVGPHRHDIIFNINNSPALTIASRGEARTILLALKFIEVSIIEDFTDKKPIILLDDVFSELDASRQKLLATRFTNHQIIMTSATNNAGKSAHVITL